MAGLPVWGTLIGLLRHGAPVYGLMHQPFTGERFFGDGASASYRGRQGERKLRRPSLRGLVRRRSSRRRARACSAPAQLAAYERVERETPDRPLRLRLLRLLHARRRPYRPRHRGGPQALRHRRPDPDHRGRRRRSSRPGTGESAAKGGSVVAAGDRRIHEAALELLNRLSGRSVASADPGMKASKAAQNSSRIASRSIRISWRAPGSTIACPALRRAAKRSITGVAQTGSAPAATTSVGVRTSSGKRGSANLRMKRKAAIEPGDGRVADGAVAERRGDVGVAGVADRVARQAVAGEALLGDRGRAAAGHVAARRGRARRSSSAVAAATFGDFTMHSASIGARRDETREGQPPHRAPRPARSPRPSNGRARNAASACRARARSPGSPRGRARTGRNSATWPLARSARPRPDRPWPRQSKATTAKPRRRSSVDGLEILLDELGPALEDADRAAVAPRRRPPARGAQRHAVLRLDRHHVRAARDRVVGGFDELQRATWRSGGRGRGPTI